MIIYGTNSKHLLTENVKGKCPNCGGENTVQMSVFNRYAHVFWIPFFPIGKTAASQCGSCKQIMQLNEMPPDLRKSYDTMKLKTSTPVYLFAGLAIVAGLVTWGVIINQQNEKENAQLILTPQKNDLYEVKLGDKQYTLFKVDSVYGDSVVVRMHLYETNKMSGVSDLKDKGDDAYQEMGLVFTKGSLKEMFDEGEIFDVERK